METERKKKKWLALVLIVVIAAVAVSIVLYALWHPQLDMDFDPMRSQTNEENQNNAENNAYMAADENYVCFQDKEYGLVCYDIRKDRYTVLERESVDTVQIENGYLYYQTYIPSKVWKVNLESKRKEKLGATRSQYVVLRNEIMKVYNGDVFWYNIFADRGITKIRDKEVTKMMDSIYATSYIIAGGYLYYNSRRQNFETEGIILAYQDIIKQNLNDSEDKVVIPISENPEEQDIKFFLRGDLVYFMRSDGSVYEVGEDKVTKIANVHAPDQKMVFYGDYIVTDGGIYSSDWEELARFDFVDPGDPFAQFIPMVVGGNLYFYSSEELDWPAVGRGYYKLDIEEYLKQNAA